MSKIRLYTALALFIAFMIIIFQNTEDVETKIFSATFNLPRAALLGLTLITGIIIGLIIAKFRARAKAKASK